MAPRRRGRTLPWLCFCCAGCATFGTADDALGLRPDQDRDGIADARDMCPREPETRNGLDDEDGCPDHLRVPLLNVHAGAWMSDAFVFPREDSRASDALMTTLAGWARELRTRTPGDLVCIAYAAPTERDAATLAAERA